MIYGSVCSGIEAASVAWEPLGWEATWFAEIDPFPSAVLAHRFPDTPNLGDFTKIHEDIKPGTIDVLIGGTPCQSFSVAGLRKGLADPRGNLALEFLRLADAARPRWLVWENVPGVLSSGGGRDFGSFLGALGKLGYGWSYRVLDAQYFGVPQRRRRVFVVGHLGDWRRAAAVLFERHSLQGHPPPSRESGAGIARCLATGSNAHRYDGDTETFVAHPVVPIAFKERGRGKGERNIEWQEDQAYCLRAVDSGGCRDEMNVAIPFDTTQITSPDNHSNPKPGDPCHTLASGMHAPAIAFHPTQDPIHSEGISHAIGCGSKSGQASSAVAYQCHGTNVGPMGTLKRGNGHVTGGVPFVPVQSVNMIERASNGVGIGNGNDPMYPLKTKGIQGVLSAMVVRRLTPVECERLQGFPDGFTAIPWRGKPAEQCPDGPRYKAIGNSMAIPPMQWLGKRIQLIEEIS